MKEQVEAWFEEFEHSGEWKKFKEIKDPPYNHRNTCGIVKLCELTGGNMNFYALSEEVELACLEDFKEPPTKEDMRYLNRCGIYFSEEKNLFYLYT